MHAVARHLAERIYGLYAVLVFAAVALPMVALLAVIPGLPRRRRAIRQAARLVFNLTGIRLTVRGLSHIPEDACVVVANHASYLDGPVLTAALPPKFGFVIKREMTQVPLAHFLLRRIGSQFVARNDAHRSAADARRLLQKARARESLAFFPEGTFTPEPGLGRFRNGAFTTAARAGMPIVPVVIRGSRYMLPAGRLLPRPGSIVVLVKKPLAVTAADGQTLLRRAREEILADLDEPDLQPAP